jgi:hypothetical protein
VVTESNPTRFFMFHGGSHMGYRQHLWQPA